MLLKDKLWECDDPYIVWLKKSKGVCKTTIYHYYTYYKDAKKIENFDQESINAFIQSKNNNSIVRAFINSMLEFMASNNIHIEFEMPPRSTGRKKKKIVKNYSSTEIKKMRDGCYNYNKYAGVMFDILFDGALRRAEIPTIKINSFDWLSYFESNKDYIGLKVEGKGNKERIVFVGRKVLDIIVQDLLDHKVINTLMNKDDILQILNGYDQKLFSTIKYGTKVWRIINKVSNKVFERSMRPHEIRHTRATQLQDMGVNIRDIQHYLGHSSPQITEVYLHTTAKTSLKHIGDKLNGV